MHQSIFSRIFPVPRFIRMPAVGFDLSSGSVKFVEIFEKRSALSVGRFQETILPPGCIVNGEVMEPKLLAEILSDIRKKYSLRHIIASLPEEKAYIFNISVPRVPPKELRESIELQLEGNIPVSPEEIQFDYEVSGVNTLTEEIEVNISALPKNIVGDYLDVFERSGLVPIAFETDAQAIARAIIPRGEKGTYMVVDFGRNRTSFYVYRNGSIAFTSTVKFGGDTITQAIMKERDVNYEEAEKIKSEKNFLVGTRDEEIFRFVVSGLSVLRDEIQKYLAYWNDKMSRESVVQGDVRKIEKVIFSGGGSAIHGISEFFATYLETSFELGNPWVNIFSTKDEVPPIHQNDSLKYSVAIGLSLFNHLKPQ